MGPLIDAWVKIWMDEWMFKMDVWIYWWMSGRVDGWVGGPMQHMSSEKYSAASGDPEASSLLCNH